MVERNGKPGHSHHNIPVIEKQLLPGLDGSFREDPDAVVAVHHHDLRVAVRVDGVVREANLVAFARRVYNKIWKDNKQFSPFYKAE